MGEQEIISKSFDFLKFLVQILVYLPLSSQVASMRGVARPIGKLPASNQPPNVMLSKELVSPSDIKFVSSLSPYSHPPSPSSSPLFTFMQSLWFLYNYLHCDDDFQISDRSEAASLAVESMEIKSGEPLVVQFSAP